MSTQETKNRSGQRVTGHTSLEVKTAMDDFLQDVGKINTELKTRIQEQDKRLNMLERKTVETHRPALSAVCLLYTSPSPRDKRQSRMPSSA